MPTNIKAQTIASTYQRLLLKGYNDSIGAGTDTINIEVQKTAGDSTHGDSVASALFISTNRVGIGIAAPTASLDVVGDIVVSGSVDGENLATHGTDIGLNNTHRGSTGIDHGYIDQDVTAGATPTFTATNISGIPVANLTGAITVAVGGTGQTTLQAAINSLTQVSGANTGELLEKDISGNVSWVGGVSIPVDVNEGGTGQTSIAQNVILASNTGGNILDEVQGTVDGTILTYTTSSGVSWAANAGAGGSPSLQGLVDTNTATVGSAGVVIDFGGSTGATGLSPNFRPNAEYIQCGNALATDLGANYAGDLTVSLWFKADTFADCGLFNLGEFSPQTAHGGWEAIGIFDMQLESANPGLVKWTMGPATEKWIAGSPEGTEIPETGIWYHLVCVYEGGNENNSRIYMNGEVVSGAPSGTFVANTDLDFTAGIGSTLQLGGRNGAVTGEVNGFNGRMEQVAVWKDALLPSEVSELYDMGRSGDYRTDIRGYRSSADLKSYYQFSEATGDIVEDLGSLGDDGQFAIISNNPPLWKWEDSGVIEHLIFDGEITAREWSPRTEPTISLAVGDTVSSLNDAVLGGTGGNDAYINFGDLGDYGTGSAIGQGSGTGTAVIIPNCQDLHLGEGTDSFTVNLWAAQHNQHPGGSAEHSYTMFNWKDLVGDGNISISYTKTGYRATVAVFDGVYGHAGDGAGFGGSGRLGSHTDYFQLADEPKEWKMMTIAVDRVKQTLMFYYDGILQVNPDLEAWYGEEGLSNDMSEITGTHTGGTSALTLTDNTADFWLGDNGSNGLYYRSIYNVTDGSDGIVLTNTSGTATLIGALTGGTLNVWTLGDAYLISGMENRSTAAQRNNIAIGALSITSGTPTYEPWLRFFDGGICNVGMWNSLLTPAEISSMAQSGRMGRYDTQVLADQRSSLRAWWPMNEGTGRVIHDLSGGGHDGYIVTTDAASTPANGLGLWTTDEQQLENFGTEVLAFNQQSSKWTNMPLIDVVGNAKLKAKSNLIKELGTGFNNQTRDRTVAEFQGFLGGYGQHINCGSHSDFDIPTTQSVGCWFKFRAGGLTDFGGHINGLASIVQQGSGAYNWQLPLERIMTGVKFDTSHAQGGVGVGGTCNVEIDSSAQVVSGTIDFGGMDEGYNHTVDSEIFFHTDDFGGTGGGTTFRFKPTIRDNQFPIFCRSRYDQYVQTMEMCWEIAVNPDGSVVTTVADPGYNHNAWWPRHIYTFAAGTIEEEKWYHIMLCGNYCDTTAPLYPGTDTGKVYLNGEYVATTNSVGTHDFENITSGLNPSHSRSANRDWHGTNIIIGNKQDLYAHHVMNGYISNCAIWNVQLTDSDVQAIYNKGRSGDYKKPDTTYDATKIAGLKGWWRLDDGEGTVVRDSSGNAHHAKFNVGDVPLNSNYEAGWGVDVDDLNLYDDITEHNLQDGDQIQYDSNLGKLVGVQDTRTYFEPVTMGTQNCLFIPDGTGAPQGAGSIGGITVGESQSTNPQNASLINKDPNFTVMMWAKLDESALINTGRFLYSQGSTTQPHGLFSIYLHTNNEILVQFRPDYDGVTANTHSLYSGAGYEFTDKKWHHIAVTVARNTPLLSIYIDGELRSSSNLSGPQEIMNSLYSAYENHSSGNATAGANNNATVIGASCAYSRGSSWHGFIDNFSIIKTDITATHVKSFYYAGRSANLHGITDYWNGTPLWNKVVCWLRFNENDGLIAYDSGYGASAQTLPYNNTDNHNGYLFGPHAQSSNAAWVDINYEKLARFVQDPDNVGHEISEYNGTEWKSEVSTGLSMQSINLLPGGLKINEELQGTNFMRVTPLGVGIGEPHPQNKLELRNTVNDGTGATKIIINSSELTAGVFNGLEIGYNGLSKIGILADNSTGEARIGCINSSGNWFLTLYAQNTEWMRINKTGEVGIGKTATAGSKLDINFGTEDLELIDAGSTGATEQDWIQVQVGGVTGYIRVHQYK